MVRPDGRVGEAADLLPTFSYAGSLAEHPPCSRFDIRDEVCLAAGGFLHGQVVKDRTGREFVAVGVKLAEGEPKLWFHPRDLGRPGAGAFPDDTAATLQEKLTPVGTFNKAARDARAKLSAGGAPKGGSRHLKEAQVGDFDVAEDSEEEEVILCCHCRLPIGDFAYTRSEKDESLVHADCMAQIVQQDFRRQAQEREVKASALKAARRAEYEIGWKPEMIARNMGPARKLQCDVLGRGLCCLKFQDGSDTLRLAPTTDPAGAVNLEYLSLALQVRFKEGTEPRFSLDPVDPSTKSADMMQSMQTKRFEPAWLAGTSAGDVLFQADYHLKELSMGEQPQPVAGMKSCLDFSDLDCSDEWKAREWFVVRKAEVQVSEDNVLVPCVKMGVEAREQRVTTYGLEDSRITRADHPLVKYAEEFTHNFDLIAERKSVIYHLRELAKASVLAKYLLEAGASMDELLFGLGEAKQCGCMEIPQLWNERSHSHFHVQDGQIVVDSKEGFGKGTHSLYGGVQFGLDIFKIYSAHERQVQGVDLNLDQFKLDAVARQTQKSDVKVPLGKAFWTNIDGTRSSLREEDASLLRAVFSPSLSDRRGEGDRFVPPITDASYMETLRGLVKEEQLLRQRRQEHFLGPRFVMGNAGPLFPSSWTASFKIERGHEAAPDGAQEGRNLRARADFQARPQRYEQITRTTAPVFDETTEDGVRFRIYKTGSLEVRTTQEHGGSEELGAVFSISSRQDVSDVDEQAKVAKVTEYVEPLPQGGASAAQWTLHCRSYVVLETEAGRSVVAEKLLDGRTLWRQDPEDLEDRNSLAKVVRSEASLSESITVRTIRERVAQGGAASASECRHYAQEIFRAACRSENHPRCGFRRQARGKWWLAGGTHVTKDKSRHTEKYYADKTFTVKFTEKNGVKYTREQYKELKETLTFLLGVHGRAAPVAQDHESVFNIRMH